LRTSSRRHAIGRTAEFEEYHDPRLVAHYDSWDPDRGDISFYIDLAAQISAESVVDLGCGTGLLAVELARRGCQVTGIDPSKAMLDFARARPDAEKVHWIQGDATALGEQQFDLAVMTGHVVQVIQDDRELLETFAAIRRALRPGGRLAFDSRNRSTVRNVADWTPQKTLRTLAGGVQVWIQDAIGDGDHVAYTLVYRFPDGQEVLSRNELRYRSFAWLAQALTDSGFHVDPPDHEAADHIFLATQPTAGQDGGISDH
jgi:SAM-dependent methyltransferase